jgi:predicted transcriptional regulator
MSTLTIEVTPDLEHQLQEKAARHGQQPAEYILNLLKRELSEDSEERPFYETATLEEWEAALDELAEGHENLPDLPTEAFSRANIYAEHD